MAPYNYLHRMGLTPYLRQRMPTYPLAIPAFYHCQVQRLNKNAPLSSRGYFNIDNPTNNAKFLNTKATTAVNG